MDSSNHALDVSLNRFAAANIHYDVFGKLLESPLSWPQFRDNTSYYRLFSKLIEGFSPLFIGCKGEDVKLGGAQHNDSNTGYLSSNNNSKSEDKNDTSRENKNDSGRKGEDDASREDEENSGRKGEDGFSEKDKDDAGGEFEDNAGGKDKDNNNKEGENDNGGQDKDDVDENGEILNMKSRVGNGNKTSNLGEIADGKLAFCYIANVLVDIFVYVTITFNYPAVSLVVSVIPLITGITALGCAAPSFPAFGCPIFGLFIFFVPGLPTFS